MYAGIWWQTLDANRQICSLIESSRNIFCRNCDLFECEKFQISFAMTIISLFFVPPIFVDRKELLYCPPEYVQIEAETILKMSTELAWLPSTPIHLCVNWTLVDSTDNPLILSGNNLPNPSWRRLFWIMVLEAGVKTDFPFQISKLLTHHCNSCKESWLRYNVDW